MDNNGNTKEKKSKKMIVIFSISLLIMVAYFLTFFMLRVFVSYLVADICLVSFLIYHLIAIILILKNKKVLMVVVSGFIVSVFVFISSVAFEVMILDTIVYNRVLNEIESIEIVKSKNLNQIETYNNEEIKNNIHSVTDNSITNIRGLTVFCDAKIKYKNGKEEAIVIYYDGKPLYSNYVIRLYNRKFELEMKDKSFQ